MALERLSEGALSSEGNSLGGLRKGDLEITQQEIEQNCYLPSALTQEIYLIN